MMVRTARAAAAVAAAGLVAVGLAAVGLAAVGLAAGSLAAAGLAAAAERRRRRVEEPRHGRQRGGQEKLVSRSPGVATVTLPSGYDARSSRATSSRPTVTSSRSTSTKRRSARAAAARSPSRARGVTVGRLTRGLAGGLTGLACGGDKMAHCVTDSPALNAERGTREQSVGAQ